MAHVDYFLKIDGIDGESSDHKHKSEIEVLSWSWGMQTRRDVVSGAATGRAAMQDLKIVTPHLDPREMADLVAFLTAYRYYLTEVGQSGSPAAGVPGRRL